MPKKEKKEKKISAKNIAAENNNKKDDEALKCAIQNETKHLFTCSKCGEEVTAINV